MNWLLTIHTAASKSSPIAHTPHARSTQTYVRQLQEAVDIESMNQLQVREGRYCGGGCGFEIVHLPFCPF